jgi:hypothetical protein
VQAGGTDFGSLGHVHRLAVRVLQIVGLPKTKAKLLARYSSVSAVVGSLAALLEKNSYLPVPIEEPCGKGSMWNQVVGSTFFSKSVFGEGGAFCTLENQAYRDLIF